MIRKLKNAIRDGIKSQEQLLERLGGELDLIYDLIHQVFGDEAASLEALQATLRKASRRIRGEQYERYLRLWAFRLTVECVQRQYPRFVAELPPGQKPPLAYLSLEEKLVALLHDRAQLNYEQIASVLQIPVGRVGCALAYAREKIAKEKFKLTWPESLTLLERIGLNRRLDSEQDMHSFSLEEKYQEAISHSRNFTAALEGRSFSEIESNIRMNKILPILSSGDTFHWQSLPWQWKLGLEASALGVVGLFAVVVVPWVVSTVDFRAALDGRFQDVIISRESTDSFQSSQEISTDRLLASSLEQLEAEANAPKEEDMDEFANVEFPSGDANEFGSAPTPPSKQQVAIYRLIVQSPSPRDLIPSVRSIFAGQNVKERESSGRVMPGGVYFDGITNIGTYPTLLSEIEKLGETKPYSNVSQKRNPLEKARIVVWVQQI